MIHSKRGSKGQKSWGQGELGKRKAVGYCILDTKRPLAMVRSSVNGMISKYHTMSSKEDNIINCVDKDKVKYLSLRQIRVA